MSMLTAAPAESAAAHWELAAGQRGLLARRQLVALGWSDAQIRSASRRGMLVALTPRVLLVAGAPLDHEVRALAAVLDAGDGAALARTSGLALWGIRGFELPPFHVVRRHGPGGPGGQLGRVHQSRVLPDDHVVRYRSIPVTTPARTLLDVADVISAGRLERALESAWAERLVTFQALAGVLEHGPRTRPGHARLRRLVEARGPGYRPCGSALELRVGALMAEAGLTFRQQVDCGGDDWVGRTDFLADDAPLVLEVQSERFHSTQLDVASDARRAARLAAAGYTVIEVREHDVWYAPAAVVDRVRTAHEALRR